MKHSRKTRFFHSLCDLQHLLYTSTSHILTACGLNFWSTFTCKLEYFDIPDESFDRLFEDIYAGSSFVLYHYIQRRRRLLNIWVLLMQAIHAFTSYVAATPWTMDQVNTERDAISRLKSRSTTHHSIDWTESLRRAGGRWSHSRVEQRPF